MQSDLTLCTIASLLRRGKLLDHLSNVITLAALLWGLLLWPLGAGTLVGTVLAVVLVVAGLVQKYWAARVAFDADLFAMLGAHASHVEARTADLDQSLIALGLLPPARAGRPWPERSRGALGLLRTQAAIVAFQAALAISSLIVMPWLFGSSLMS